MLASPLTSRFYAMTQEAKEGRQQKEYGREGRKARQGTGETKAQTWPFSQSRQGTRWEKPSVIQEPSVFFGRMKCSDCGGNLNFHFNQGNHDIKHFSCNNRNSSLRKCNATYYIWFTKMSKRYEQEQGEIGAKVKALRLELKKTEGQRMDVEEFLETVRRYTILPLSLSAWWSS